MSTVAATTRRVGAGVGGAGVGGLPIAWCSDAGEGARLSIFEQGVCEQGVCDQGIWLCDGERLPDRLWASLSQQRSPGPGASPDPGQSAGSDHGHGPGTTTDAANVAASSAAGLGIVCGADCPACAVRVTHPARAASAYGADDADGTDDRAVSSEASFGQGSVLDELRPGPELALLLPTADEHSDLADHELTGVVRGWRRLGSWVAAMEHAAVAELVTRRVSEAGAAGARNNEAERYAAAEVAAALTLTRFSAEALADRALLLAELSATWAALASGQIDVPRALVIMSGVAGLDGALARRIEAKVLEKASAQTTGELRKAVAGAVIAADPAAAERRLAEAEKSARVERWAEQAGTCAIAGRDLPPAEALAADNRVNALAAALRADGADGGMDLLRAQVFLGLLLGRPVGIAPLPATTKQSREASGQSTGLESQSAAGHCGTDLGAGRREQGGRGPDHGAGPREQGGRSTDLGAGLREQGPCGTAQRHPEQPGPEQIARSQQETGGSGSAFAGTTLATSANPQFPFVGSINLTVPLQTLLGLSPKPGEVSGFGPVTPATAAEILTTARGSPGVRWCVTVTDERGRAAGHGCATPKPARSGGWTLTVRVHELAVGICEHDRESPAYKPPPSLRHLIQIRNVTCVFPGCGRPARQCDCDHTIPYHKGGLTCECNVAPLCRAHHRTKQSPGWRLDQPRPGVLQWFAPSGWKYTTLPDAYPT